MTAQSESCVAINRVSSMVPAWLIQRVTREKLLFSSGSIAASISQMGRFETAPGLDLRDPALVHVVIRCDPT